MKIRKRWVILGAVVLAVLAAGGWYRYHTTTDEYKARKLVAELRECYTDANPGPMRQWLIDLGLMKEKWIRSDEEILGDLVALGETAVPALIESLKDEDIWVRFRTVSALGRIGPPAKQAIPALIQQTLEDKAAIMWSSATWALDQIGPVAVPDLIQALKDGDSTMRQCAASALGGIGSSAKAAVPALIQTLKDENAQVRYNTASALGKIGPSAESAVPALIHALKDKSVDVRVSVTRALGNIGPAAKEAVPALIELLKSDFIADLGAWYEEEDARRFAAEALGNIGPLAKAAVPALIRILKDKDSTIREETAAALGWIGPVTKEVIPILVRALEDKDASVRIQSAVALLNIDFERFLNKSVSIIIEVLKEGDNFERCRAAEVLDVIGPSAKAAIPALRESLKDEDEDVRQAATYALKKIEAKAEAE